MIDDSGIVFDASHRPDKEPVAKNYEDVFAGIIPEVVGANIMLIAAWLVFHSFIGVSMTTALVSIPLWYAAGLIIMVITIVVDRDIHDKITLSNEAFVLWMLWPFTAIIAMADIAVQLWQGLINRLSQTGD